MLYGFTVTKHGTDAIPISKIISTDYNRIWQLFQQKQTSIIYKYMHHGNNHIHYHGLLFAQKYIDFKQFMIEGYSIVFEKDVNYERWHNYCKHEEREEMENIKRVEREFKEHALYRRVMNVGSTKYVKPNILMTLKISGGI